MPIRLGGSKRPDGTCLPVDPDTGKAGWKPLTERRPTEHELQTWFGNGRPRGLAIVGGAVSGHLESIDVDDAALLEPFEALVAAEAPELLARLVKILTPRPGYRLVYRCEAPVEGNLVLARRQVDTLPPGHPELKTLIETRGEGGCMIVPGSPPEVHETGRPYQLMEGDLAAPPVLTVAERQTLLRCARALNEYVEPERTRRSPSSHSAPRSTSSSDEKLPGDDFNERGDFPALLQKHGWTRDQRIAEHWIRPGKTHGVSATLGHVADGVLYVFSSNADPFEPGHAYDLFAAYALLEHDGDFSDAAKALYRAGYGDRVKSEGQADLGDDEVPPASAFSGDDDVEPADLETVLATFRKWLHLPDDGHIKVTLGAYAANRMAGDPVWVMIIGAPSSGKTEALVALDGRPHVRMTSAITGEASLLSGTPKRDKAVGSTGGILCQIGKFGVLLLKDFTSILAMKHETRALLLAALREIYDGSWHRDMGVDGGKRLSWEGKLGLIAGCTEAIDSHHAVISAMGERFVFYRLPRASEADARAQAKAARKHLRQEDTMRQELSAAVASLFAGVRFDREPETLTEEEENRLIDMAVLGARCRSAVERDGRTRDIVQIPAPEAPARLVGALERLLHGLLAIGTDRAEAWHLLARVTVDSMPALRWAVFQHAAEFAPPGQPALTTAFATALHHPTSTVERALEDLDAHGLLLRTKEKGKNHWELTDWARSMYEGLKPYFCAYAGTRTRKLPNDGMGPPPPPSSDPETTEGEFSGTRAYSGTQTTGNGVRSNGAREIRV